MAEEENKNCEADIAKTKKQSRRFLVVYIVGLFSVALVLILLSYFTQVRANEQLANMKSEVSEQTTVAQGAQQQMLALQSIVEQQQGQIEKYQIEMQEIRDAVGAIDGQSIEDAVDEQMSFIEDKYTALEELQQVRRLSESEDDISAKEVLEVMISNYGMENLLPFENENAVLLGQNAVEFFDLCNKYGISTSEYITVQQ